MLKSDNDGPAPSKTQKKSKWTSLEDEQLRQAVETYGTESWNRIASLVTSRNGKQCREPWIGQLAPSVSKDVWLPDEDLTLIRTHAICGNHWTAIAAQLPTRSPLSVKNRWNWLLRHEAAAEQVHQTAPAEMLDVVEKGKPHQTGFEPLNLDERVFGSAFHEFQVRMLMGNVPQ
jgi:myb proto-oncogene protein